MNTEYLNLLKSLEQLHSDVLAVLVESKLDPVAKHRLREVAEGLVVLTRELQTQPNPDHGWFKRNYQRLGLLVRCILGLES